MPAASPPVPELLAAARAAPRELTTYALAQLLLHWPEAEAVLLTSAAVGVYLGFWRADVALLALKLCDRVASTGVPWSGVVTLNAPRFLAQIEVDAPDALALTSPRDLRAVFTEAITRPRVAPRYPGDALDRSRAVRGDLLLRALETLADDEDDVVALWWHGADLHAEGPGFRVILRADESAEGEPAEDQWFDRATIEDVLRARLDRKGDRP